MLKLVHISDLHIGKVFDKYPGPIKEALQAARIGTLEKIIDFANTNPSSLLVIAGDLFDRVNIPTSLIMETTRTLRAYHGLVLVLPGNHDFSSSSQGLWQTFKDNSGENTLVLDDYRPYDLKEYGVDAVIYPCYCQSKHSEENALGWIAPGLVDQARVNIGLAHGALEGISPDLQGQYFTMEKSELTSLPMDLWLLGHTHVPYPLSGENPGERIFNAGVHEPDGMNYRHKGSFFYIGIDKEGIQSQRIESGTYRFEDRYDRVEDLEAYLKTIDEGYENTLLRLNLSGRLDEDDYKARRDMYKKLADKVFYLDVRDDDLTLRLSPDLISEKFVHGSFPEKMLLKLKDEKDALQLAYELIEESR